MIIVNQIIVKLKLKFKLTVETITFLKIRITPINLIGKQLAEIFDRLVNLGC